ncbi:hypothetical protein [Bdellovibrio bacteriovorus]|uniref:hypothetical protein n=1 Tax=Bdellovibrio bacteriovorus TaxID=959 RepID=UPI00031E58D4|nr:hypothetical protein [Bdellovibrio bacteriovorus]
MKLLFIAIVLSSSVVHATSPSVVDLSVFEKPLSEKKVALKKMSDKNMKFYLLSTIVRDYSSLELTVAVTKEAKSFSKSLLEMVKGYEKDWNYGNAIHHGNLVLGRVALYEGNLKAAKEYLILATKTSGSPQLHSFGPNMTLAKELLEKGEKSAVLSYLDACLLFWTTRRAKGIVDAWKSSIDRGEVPDFGANLEF